MTSSNPKPNMATAARFYRLIRRNVAAYLSAERRPRMPHEAFTARQARLHRLAAKLGVSVELGELMLADLRATAARHPAPVLGWSAAVDRYGDPTGRCHLLVDRNRDGYAVAVPACGSKGRTCGQIHDAPPDYAPNVCGTCARTARRLGVEVPR